MNTLSHGTTGVPSLHGVLYQENGVIYLHRQYNQEAMAMQVVPSALADLCEIVLSTGVTHLWVMPSLDITPDHTFFDASTERYDLRAVWEWDESTPLEEDVQNLLVSVTGCRRPKGGQKWLNVIFPAQCRWSWYYDEITAPALIKTVNTMERALNVVVGAGPTTVGMKLYESISKERPSAIPELVTMPYAKASSSIIWEATSPLPGVGYIHKVDKNSAFLRACQEVAMGIGTPIHIDGPFALAHKIPGLWRITAMCNPSVDLPPALWRDVQWVTSPTLKMLNYLKIPYEVHEGYYWKDTVKALKAWAEFLWLKRQELKPVDEGAYDGIKDVAATTVGLFNADMLATEKSWKYRPDFWHTVVDECRAQMFYNIIKYRNLYGVTPYMVDIDALFYLSDEPDIRKAIPGILDHADSLGGYKHVWTLPLDDKEVQAALHMKGINLRVGALNDIAEERGM